MMGIGPVVHRVNKNQKLKKKNRVFETERFRTLMRDVGLLTIQGIALESKKSPLY